MDLHFQFKQFSLVKNTCGMPVSTDGILLGAWAKAKMNDNILDIGTGTGLLALMMAQRFPASHILAVDIDEEAVNTARFNVARSPWANTIKVEHTDVTAWRHPPLFETVICNPPYFDNGQRAKNEKRAQSRHTHTLSHDALLHMIQKCLTENGRAHLILPTLQADALLQNAPSFSLYCHHSTSVRTTPIKAVSRKLITLSKQITTKQLNDEIIIQEGGKYTSAFISLTKDFYLKM